MNGRADSSSGRPGPTTAAGAVLRGVETDLAQLDELDGHEQVARYDSMHGALAQALTATADDGGSPGLTPAHEESGA